MKRRRWNLLAGVTVVAVVLAVAISVSVGAVSSKGGPSSGDTSGQLQPEAPTATPQVDGQAMRHKGDMSIPITLKNPDGSVAMTTTLQDWVDHRDQIMKELGWTK